jgi:hypothetical protein
MKKHWMASLLALLSCYFANACKKGDGWDEYKYRDAGFAISAPFMPVPARPSPEEPNTRAYAINYNSRTGIVISAGPLDMWENVSDTEKLQRMKDLMLQGSVSKLVSEKEISLDGNPGIEMEIENTNFHLRARYYMVNGKVFALQSSAPSDLPFATDTDRIFDSLRLLR